MCSCLGENASTWPDIEGTVSWMSIKGTFNATLRDPLTIFMSAQGTQDPMKIVRSGKESWY